MAGECNNMAKWDNFIESYTLPKKEMKQKNKIYFVPAKANLLA